MVTKQKLLNLSILTIFSLTIDSQMTLATSFQRLGDLPGGSFSSIANGISVDGSTVVGRSINANDFEAFIWDSTNGMVGLGDLPGGAFSSEAYDVSGDGSTVVGQSNSDNGSEAFIWDNTNGMRSLEDVLINDFNLDLTGWSLYQANAISDDGLIIAGSGINPDGNTEAWIATLDSTSSASVPFDFSPTWGILMVGSAFSIARFRKIKAQKDQL